MKKRLKKRGFDAVREVRSQFTALRLSQPDRPVDKNGEPLEPRVPHDLTVLKDQALGQLFSEFAVMQQYCQAAMGWIEAKKLLDKRAARLTRAEAKVAHKGKAATLEAYVDLEPQTRAKEDQATVSDAVATITGAMLKSFEIGRESISREMTRRIALREYNNSDK